MLTRNKKIIGGVIAVLITTIATFTILRSTSASIKESDITVPAGWYVHRIDDENIILTRQQELPDIGLSEGLAYGEQIDSAVEKLDQPVEMWINWRVPNNDPAITVKERGILSGYQTLRVEHEALAAGKVLDYYLFVDNRAYIFSLYPLESYDSSGKNLLRNTTNIKILEQIVKDFAGSLSSQ